MADKKDFIVRAGLTVSTNASVNTALSVGNSTVNTTVNSTSISTSNLVVTTVTANGGVGSNGQVLTSNGTTAYWGTVVGVNTDYQYVWTNTHTFGNSSLGFYANNVGLEINDLGGSYPFRTVLAANLYSVRDVTYGSNVNITPYNITFNDGGGNTILKPKALVLGTSNTQNSLGNPFVGVRIVEGTVEFVNSSNTDQRTEIIQSGVKTGITNYAINGYIDIDGGGTLFTMRNGFVGINTFSPDYTLSVDGDVQIIGGLVDSYESYGTNGQVLTTDGTYIAWANVSIPAEYVQNTDSRTLSGNLVFSGANVTFSSAAYVGPNVVANTSGLFIGNSTVNTAIIAGSVTIDGTVLAGNTYLTTTYAPLASPTFTGTVATVNITSNSIVSNTVTTNNSTVNANLTVRSIVANGSLGSSGQVLTTNGANVYWSTVSGGGGGGTAYNSIYLQYTGNGTNTVFSVPGGYAANSIGVYINGALLRNGSDVDVSSGSSITFTEAPPSGSLIDIIGQSTIYANGVSSVVNQQFTGNGTANSFTVTNGYLPNTAIVFLNGVKQLPGTDVITTSGTTVDFTTPPGNNYTIDVYAYQAAVVQSNSALTVGNTIIGLNQISVGNSTINTFANSTTLTIGGNTLTVGTSTYFATNGNVGIGTASPAQRLDVSAAVNSVQARFGNIAGRGLEISTSLVAGTNDAGSILNAKGSTSGTMIFQTDSNERMRITANGYIGIGTTTPASDFQIVKSGNTVTNLIVQNSGTGTNSAYVASVANVASAYLQQYSTGEAYVYTTGSSIFVGSSVASPMYFYTNGVSRGIVTAAGDYGVGVLSPATKLDVLGAIRSGGGTDSGTQLVMYSNTSSGDCYIAGYNLTLHTGANNSRIQRMKLDNNGIVTMPYQTAFDAYGSGTQNWTGTSQYLVLQLGSQLSLGSRSTGYNTSTYRFTAPVTGTYAFFCKITQTTTVTGPGVYIFVNGAAVGHEITIGYSTQYFSASGFLIYQMNAGDYADLRVMNNNNTTMTIDLGRSSFSGHLIG